MLKKFIKDQAGSTAVEYAILVGIIGVVGLSASQDLWKSADETFKASANIIEKGAYGTSDLVAPQWQLSTATIALRHPYKQYAKQLVAIDPQGSEVTYSLQSGSLPSWMVLSSSGLLYGSGTWSQTYNPVIRAEDDQGDYSDITLTLSPVVAERQTCLEHYNAGVRVTGYYELDPDGSSATSPIPVWCDMETDGGGWALVSRGAGSAGATGWSTTTAINGDGAKSPTGTETFKYADSLINDLTTGTPTYRAEFDYYGDQKVFWQGVSYGHLTDYDGSDCDASISGVAGSYNYGSCDLENLCGSSMFRGLTAYETCSSGYFVMNYNSSGWRIGDGAGNNCVAGEVGCDYTFWVR